MASTLNDVKTQKPGYVLIYFRNKTVKKTTFETTKQKKFKLFYI